MITSSLAMQNMKTVEENQYISVCSFQFHYTIPDVCVYIHATLLKGLNVTQLTRYSPINSIEQGFRLLSQNKCLPKLVLGWFSISFTAASNARMSCGSSHTSPIRRAFLSTMSRRPFTVSMASSETQCKHCLMTVTSWLTDNIVPVLKVDFRSK